MDDFLKTVFLHEVERQSRFALIAAVDMQNALNAHDMDRIWYAVQALLIAVGNISKLLWPPTSKYEERGSSLRTLLNVPNDSALAPRTFRNHFEHFDDRLHEWATSSPHRNFADSNVGPPGMIVGLDAGDFLRNFDTQNLAVTFRGDTYALQPVVRAVEALHQEAARLTRAV